MTLSKRISGVGLVILTVLLAALVTGCGGGGGGGTTPPAQVTGVSGTIVDADSGQGIGGMTVVVGAQTAVSQTAAPVGSFVVGGLTQGTHQLVVLQSALFAPVPGPAVMVNVVAGQVTNVGNVYVLGTSSNPPLPPSPF